MHYRACGKKVSRDHEKEMTSSVVSGGPWCWKRRWNWMQWDLGQELNSFLLWLCRPICSHWCPCYWRSVNGYSQSKRLATYWQGQGLHLSDHLARSEQGPPSSVTQAWMSNTFSSGIRTVGLYQPDVQVSWDVWLIWANNSPSSLWLSRQSQHKNYMANETILRGQTLLPTRVLKGHTQVMTSSEILNAEQPKLSWAVFLFSWSSFCSVKIFLWSCCLEMYFIRHKYLLCIPPFVSRTHY